jgi:hypothetical protein
MYAQLIPLADELRNGLQEAVYEAIDPNGVCKVPSLRSMITGLGVFSLKNVTGRFGYGIGFGIPTLHFRKLTSIKSMGNGRLIA